MEAVAGGTQAGESVDGPLVGCPTPQVHAKDAVPPSVAVAALCALRVLVQDEHASLPGKGEPRVSAN